MQSIVSVPTKLASMNNNRSLGNSHLRGSSCNIRTIDSSEEIEKRMKLQLVPSTTTSHRLADSLRPMSPILEDRHSAFEYSSRSRRTAYSCPPPVSSRHQKCFDRDISIPPSRRTDTTVNNRRQNNKNTSTQQRDDKGRSCSGSSSAPIFHKRKPNFVSTKIVRHRVFGGSGRTQVSHLTPTAVL